MKSPTEAVNRSLEREAREAGVYSSYQESDAQEIVIPVIQEQIEVHKELHSTGTVRIWKTVQDRQELVQESLIAEKIQVERVPKNQIVDSPPPVRTEGEITIIPVVEEVLVVTKQLRLIEELRITKCRTTSDYQEEVTVRTEEVHVERGASEALQATETNNIQKEK